MTCPLCGEKTTVLDSRPKQDSIHRRRKCIHCGFKFSTEEIDSEFYNLLQRTRIKSLRGEIRSATDQAIEKLKELYRLFE